MKRYAHFYVLSACILLAAALLAFAPGRSAASPAQPAPADAYRVEKLNEVSDMVLGREVVPQDYLRYLPEALHEPIEQYNAETCVLKNNYGHHAVGIAKSLFYERDKDPGDYLRGDLFYAMIDRISTLALYRNAEQLCQTDPVLSYPLTKESGGSYGIWAYMLHKQAAVGEDLAQQIQDYFTMIDGLLAQLDDSRQALS